MTTLNRAPQPALLSFLMSASLTMISGCGGEPTHGRFSALTANVAQPGALCSHRVPEEACVQCHPKLASQFKEVGDWCAPHHVPESQCHECHPDLSFEPLPQPPAHADLKDVQRPDDLKALSELSVSGKVTVVDIWAVWCVPCRKTLGDLHLLMSHDKLLAVRKIEITGWGDPVASRFLAGSAKLPLLIIFNRRGEEVGRVSGHQPQELEELLNQARQ